MLGITDNSDSSALYEGTTPNKDNDKIVKKQLWIQKNVEKNHLEIKLTQSFYAKKAKYC